MKISGISTPALIVDANILKANAEAMTNLLSGGNLQLRPHFKSHKCAGIARWQVESGAIGMTCAKLSEAEDLCDAGIENILIANQIVDPVKVRRVADLARNCRLTICVDNAENIAALSAAAKSSHATVYCLVEFDIGMERCGVVTNEAVLALAQQIIAADNLEFEGIQAYAGHISHIVEREERAALTAANYRLLEELIAYLNANGIAVKTVSGGSTGTAQIKKAEGLYNELQAGSYLFMDACYKELDVPFKNSLFVLTTVVSRRGDLTVVDAGVKTCGVDQGMPVPVGGTAKEIVASEEHFQLHGYTGCEQVGDKMRLIPGHCCSTINLHDKIYVVDGDKVIARIPVTARFIGR